MPSKKQKKRRNPEHNTPPHKGPEKKNKLEHTVHVEEMEFYCDRCTSKVDDLVQCERCEMWLCGGCEKISADVINLIGSFSESRIHWFCRICDKLAMKAVKTYSHMSNPLTKEISSCFSDTVVKPLNAVIDRVEKSVSNIQTRIIKSLDDKMASSATHSNSNVDSSTPHSNLTAADIVDEYRDRERRKLNVVVYNVPESKAEDSSRRKKDDATFVNSIFEALEIAIPEMVDVTRLGPRNPDKNRILRVTFSDLEQKRSLLTNSKKLRLLEKFKKVYVNPDLSFQERKTQKVLRDELTRRKKAGEKDIYIRRGQIVMKSNQTQQEMDSSPKKDA